MGLTYSSGGISEAEVIALIAANGGKLGQVVAATKTNTASVAGTTPSNLFSITITPSALTSKVLIFGMLNIGHSTGSGYPWFMNLLRGATILQQGDAAGVRTRAMSSGGGSASPAATACIQTPVLYLDSPITTSAVTYNISFWTGDASATVYLNRTSRDSDVVNEDARTVSDLVALEIKA